MITRMAVLALLALGCAPNEPRVTADKMPPGFQTLVVGVSTEDAVKKLFPKAKRIADRALGGDQVVRRGDTPAIHFGAVTRRKQRRDLERQNFPEASIAHDLERNPASLADDSPWDAVELDLAPPSQGAAPVLIGFSVSRLKAEGSESLCDMLRRIFGKDPELTRCGGTNRVFKDRGESLEWCAGTADGKERLVIECGPSTVGGVTSEYLSYEIW